MAVIVPKEVGYRRVVRTMPLVAIVAFLIGACAPLAAAPSPRPSPAAVPTTAPAPILTAAPSETVAPTPTPSPPPTLPLTGAQPTAVRFVDPVRGWIGTDDGILATADGGTTWERQLAAGSITKIWAYDRTRAWALAGLSALYRTEDGSHWTPVAQLPFPLIVDLHVVDPLVLFAIGAAPAPDGPAPAQRFGRLMRSDDGGATWQVAGTRTLWSVCFDTPTSGIGADGKQVFRTQDAGRSWTLLAELQVADNGPWYPSLACVDSRNARVQVTEPKVGLGNAAWLVFRTTDSGASWSLEYRQGYMLGSITPPNTPDLGSYPSLIGTLTRARTWFLTCTPAANVQELRVADPQGAVLSTEQAPFVSCARDASFTDERHGWAVATIYQLNGTQTTSSRVLMRTTDGRTWDRVYPAIVRS